ncbi:histidine kinase dimerization/phospho-acceptor domain-containing protein [Nocardioides sp. GXQ0305]|uniref:histidine kinase dimerization/phospho-acceptor domain-containing protein n=1 Tax=Nocardioides sp. GXQ0305 TaxID=3423912 RepID=UPI003D7DE475
MRERLAAAFGALAVAAVLLTGALRLVALDDLLREETYSRLDDQARVVAAVLDQRAAEGAPIPDSILADLLDDQARIEFLPEDGSPSQVLEGDDYAGDGAGDVVAREESAAGMVVMSAAAPTPLDYYADDVWSLVMLGALVALLASLAGWWLATRLSAPFTRLAGAAAALGRGRFDLELPETRVPEAQAIGRALRASAAQLETRLARERDFAEHASHVLRTPLTGLRLELEDLTLRDDLPPDAQEVTRRCVERVDTVNASVGDLVELSRSPTLVEGAETTVEDLARHVAQNWSDRLAGRRTVSAAVEGDLSLRLTPGPLEQLLDLVLDDVRRGSGPARLVFVGEGGHVRVRLAPGTVPGRGRRDGVDAAAVLAGSQGGRVTGADDGEVELLLPRR